MSLPWTALDPFRFTADFTGATGGLTSSGGNLYYRVTLAFVVRAYLRPFSYEQNEFNRDSGYLFFRRVSDGLITELLELATMQPDVVWGNANHASFRLSPACAVGDVAGAGHDDSSTYPWPGYVSPFLDESQGRGVNDVLIYGWIDKNNTGTSELIHYQPWAYFGKSSVIMAALFEDVYNLRYANDDILINFVLNQAEFDNAYDNELNDLYVWTQEGKTVADHFKKIISHHAEAIITIDISGRLAFCDTANPLYNDNGITPGDMGAITIDFVKDKTYTINKAYVRFGAMVHCEGHDLAVPPGGDKNFAATFEEMLKNDVNGKWRITVDDTVSQAYYGILAPKEKEQDNKDDPFDFEKWQTINLPYFRSSSWPIAIADRIDGGPESFVPRVLTIEADLRGLNFDVGHVVYNSYLTSGPIWQKAIKIKQTVDWQNLRVTSVWLEEQTSGY